MTRQQTALVFLALCAAACGGTDRATAGRAAPALSAEAASSFRILVIGGTSGIGLETVKLALQRGHQVTAMARRPERMTLSHERLQTIKGDVSDPAAVESALAGQDAVVFTIGIGPTRKPVSVFSEGTRNVLNSMPEHGAAPLIMVTGIGAGDSRGHGTLFYDFFVRPVLLNTVYEDKDRSEALLRASDANWTIVRPGFLNDDASAGNYRIISDMEGIKAGDIARADVAHFVLSALETGCCRGETVLLTN